MQKYLRYATLALILFMGLLPTRGHAQTAVEELQPIVETMYTDSSAEDRFLACRNLITGMVEVLKAPNSFENVDLDGLRGVATLYPPDSSFRIMSWELHVERDLYRHYGAIQFPGEKLKLLPLIDRGDQLQQNPETAVMSDTSWLGYAAYKIVPGGVYQGKDYYFLFGYDSYEGFRRRKVLDVLWFDENRKPSFGLPVFATYTDSGLLREDRVRIILEYGAEATVAFRFDPDMEAIVYENLIVTQGSPETGPLFMPDGSYHALRPGDDGRWQEDDKVFEHVYDTAPRDPGKVGEEKRDLLGRKN